jgi:hypothetical protein
MSVHARLGSKTYFSSESTDTMLPLLVDEVFSNSGTSSFGISSSDSQPPPARPGTWAGRDKSDPLSSNILPTDQYYTWYLKFRKLIFMFVYSFINVIVLTVVLRRWSCWKASGVHGLHPSMMNHSVSTVYSHAPHFKPANKCAKIFSGNQTWLITQEDFSTFIVYCCCESFKSYMGQVMLQIKTWKNIFLGMYRNVNTDCKAHL